MCESRRNKGKMHVYCCSSLLLHIVFLSFYEQRVLVDPGCMGVSETQSEYKVSVIHLQLSKLGRVVTDSSGGHAFHLLQNFL